MPLFWPFNHHRGADDLGRCRDIKEQWLCGSRGHKDRSGGQLSLEFVKSVLSLGGPCKALGFLQEPVQW